MKKKVRMVFCMEQLIFGGIETCLLRLVEHLLKSSNCDLSLIIKKNNCEPTLLDFFRSREIPVYIIEDWEQGEASRGGCCAAIFRRIRRKLRIRAARRLLAGADVIIDYFNCSFARILRGIKPPKIGWYHSGAEQYEKLGAARICKWAELYDRFVVLTKSHYEKIACSGPLGRKAVHIYNPFDIEKIRRAADHAEYPAGRYFTFVGRLHHDKDHRTVIEAFEKIAPRYPDVRIYFIGDGELREQYARLVKEKGLEERICLLGSMANPYGYMKHAVANVLSSPSEGLSTVLIEAAILGTLNIASQCPSVSEILMEGRAGLLYRVGDSEKLARLMEDALEGKVEKEKLLDEAACAIARFDIKTTASQFESMCDRVIKEKCRLGIVGFCFEDENYGAVLTAYALGKLLQDRGYSVKHLAYVPYFYKKRRVKDAANFASFKQKYLPMTPELSYHGLKKANKEFDAFIVGSDQTFRHSFVRKEKGVYYLSFVRKNKKKLSYASSFGVDHYDGKPKDKSKVKAWFERFHALSVREKDGVSILRDEFGVSAVQTLDPVFMINWEHLASDFKYADTVCYILHPQLQRLAENNMLGSPLTIENWISAIRNAKMMITDSFHGMCFCIIFRTPFVALAHAKSPTSRLHSLFDMFSIPRESIVYTDGDIAPETLAEHVICPPCTDAALEHWRKISDDFINQTLEM